eukprot:Awhi_evm1s7910
MSFFSLFLNKFVYPLVSATVFGVSLHLLSRYIKPFDLKGIKGKEGVNKEKRDRKELKKSDGVENDKKTFVKETGKENHEIDNCKKRQTTVEIKENLATPKHNDNTKDYQNNIGTFHEKRQKIVEIKQKLALSNNIENAKDCHSLNNETPHKERTVENKEKILSLTNSEKKKDNRSDFEEPVKEKEIVVDNRIHDNENTDTSDLREEENEVKLVKEEKETPICVLPPSSSSSSSSSSLSSSSKPSEPSEVCMENPNVSGKGSIKRAKNVSSKNHSKFNTLKKIVSFPTIENQMENNNDIITENTLNESSILKPNQEIVSSDNTQTQPVTKEKDITEESLITEKIIIKENDKTIKNEVTVNVVEETIENEVTIHVVNQNGSISKNKSDDIGDDEGQSDLTFDEAKELEKVDDVEGLLVAASGAEI